ncbi:MAG: hypothetical protein DCC73_14075 [Proteobacteria bacterium]|nr:MAG: hypothetical protein DCC73_14075 [Pseudomonadota bacterium]
MEHASYSFPDLSGLQPHALLPRIRSRIAAGGDVPRFFPKGIGVRNAIKAAGAEDGVVGFQDYIEISDNCWLVASHFPVARQQAVRMIGEGLSIFHFKLSGSTLIRVPQRFDVSLTGPACFLMAHPEGVEKHEAIGPGEPQAAVTVLCRQEALREYYDEAEETYPDRLNALMSGLDQGDLGYHQGPLSPAMAAIVKGLIDIPYAGKLRAVYAEAKARELMCMMLHQLKEEGDDKQHDLVLSSRDIHRLKEAHDLLAETYTDPLTIKELARRVGLNQKKLRLGFIQLFGESMFDFCQRLRMEHAAHLMAQGETSLSRISYKVGYTYPSSFSVAFKRHFGISPKRWRPQ